VGIWERCVQDIGQGNSLYQNNIVDNDQQVLLNQTVGNSVAVFNTWGSDIVALDNGQVGNYWSDYQTNYPNASEIDNSGIWNTPYVINASSTDRYPLMTEVDVSKFPLQLLQLQTSTSAPTSSPLQTSIVSPSPTEQATLEPTQTASPSPTLTEFPLTTLAITFLAITLLVGVILKRKQFRGS
jgi:hypothetical protein